MPKPSFPPYLAAFDRKTDRWFVLAMPNLCAIKVNGQWQYSSPLSDEEIKNFELITDLVQAKKVVDQAKKALSL